MIPSRQEQAGSTTAGQVELLHIGDAFTARQERRKDQSVSALNALLAYVQQGDGL